MMKRTQPSTLAVLAMFLLAGCGAEEQPAASNEVAADFGPLEASTSINAVMVGLVDHAAHHLWDLGPDGMTPMSDADWEEVEHHAIQLIAAGSYITLGGTGAMDANWVRQEGWRAYSRDLAEAAVASYDAALRRDLSGVLAAGDDLIMSCEGCHDEYKPALPTEGIMHPHGG